MQKPPVRLPIHQQPCPSVAQRPWAVSGAYRMPDRPMDRMHVHECAELGLCLRGAGLFMIGDRVFPFGPGAVNVIEAGVPHAARSAKGTRSEWHWFFINVRLAAEGGDWPELRRSTVVQGEAATRLARALHGWADEAAAGRRLRSEAERAWVNLARVELARLGGDNEDAADAATLAPVAPALELIARDHDKPLTVAALARACRVGEGALARRFQAATGTTPYEYLLRYRIQMAATLLRETRLPVLEIALRCGYPSLSGFNRHFRERQGCAPREWRARG